MKTLFTLAVLVGVLSSSCQKNVTNETDKNKEKAAAFKAFVSAPGIKFRPVSFIAEQPIDYDETDSEVKLETDLNKYIRPYLLDDDIVFSGNSSLQFSQNTVKIPTDLPAIINMSYFVEGTSEGVLVHYIDDQYNAADYYLEDYTSTYFRLYMKRNGIKLISRYDKE
jgi:hypothetical protein